jgi:hypothetical protein
VLSLVKGEEGKDSSRHISVTLRVGGTGETNGPIDACAIALECEHGHEHFRSSLSLVLRRQALLLLYLEHMGDAGSLEVCRGM